MTKVVSGTGQASGTSTAKGFVAIKTKFGYIHLRAAERFSRQVKELELSNAGNVDVESFLDVLAVSTACVISAAAAMEAFANDIFAERYEWFPQHDKQILDHIWQKAERDSALEKFAWATLLREGKTLDLGHAPFQDAATLFELRNKLVHFKPEWDTDDGEHKRLSKRLDAVLTKNPFLKSDRNLFPRAWATHASTDWAVMTASKTITAMRKKMPQGQNS